MTTDQSKLSLPPLHPLHLQDLRKSRLTDETIQENGIYSVPPRDIFKILGGHFPKVKSLLALPYPGCDGLARYKMFPSQGAAKYYQKAGTPPRLYIPAGVEAILQNASVPLGLTEGEKKCLKAVQEGIQCIGLGGLWNWCKKDDRGEKNLIPDFDKINWKGRAVSLVPDSDWEQPDRHGDPKNLKEAVHVLAYRLIDRGARVYIVELPQGPEKVGLDDFLCQHTVEEFKALPKQEIRKKTVQEMVEDPGEDYREILKRLCSLREGEKDAAIKVLCKKRGIRVESVRQDLRGMRPGRGEIDVDRLFELEAGEKKKHSAQTLHDGKLAFGGVFGGEKILLLSDGIILPEDKESPFKFSQPKLRAIDVKKFQDGGMVSGRDLLAGLEKLFSAHIYFKDSRIPKLLALWTMATYLFKLFRFFGYIILNSPVKACGKSLLLDILSTVCFNATLRLTMPSPAVVFRQVDGDDSTLIIDEAETLGGTEQEKADLIGLLNAGFQRGAVVPRMEGKGTEMRVRYFNAYSPKALAAINKLAGTLEDRAFRILMEKKKSSEPVERFNYRKTDSIVEVLRGELSIWALKNSETVKGVYDRADEFPGLEGLSDRQRDILEPLLSVAAVVDGEAEEDGVLPTFECLKGLALDLDRAKEERERSLESIPVAVAIIQGLMNGQEEIFISNSSLLEELHKDDALGFLETTWGLAKFMRKLDVYCGQKRTEEGKQRGYTFTRAQVENWGERYA